MQKKAAYLGLDIGGTGVKAGVFDKTGRMLGFGRKYFQPTVSREGHIDIPIDVIYEGAHDAAREAVNQSGADILAMAVSSQGETFVSLDQNDRPLHDAILWYDTRADLQAKELCKAVPHAAGQINPILSVCKIMWLWEHCPDIIRKVRRFLLLPDYFAYRLTGSPTTDPNTASTSGMTVSDGSAYDPAILKAADIDMCQLADIVPSGSPAVRVLKPMAKEWRLSADTLFVSGTNDQYAGALGAGNCRPGILSVTSGTCLALVTLTNKEPANLPAGLYSGLFPINGYWFILAFSKTSGLVLGWFRKTMAPGMSFDELNLAAEKVPIGCEGLFMGPHFDGAISPVPNPKVRGAFIGLTLKHGVGHMYRAILEALTFNLVANINLLRSSGYDIEVIRAIGGGAQNTLWLQMQADATGLAIEKPAVPEAATLGAAMLAAFGRGDFKSLEEASSRLYHCHETLRPNTEKHRLYQKTFENYRRVMDSVEKAYE